MYLGKNKPGRLLEVGCGNGHRLAQYRDLGWRVEGQEVDLKAAKLARQLYDLKIHLGPVEELRIPDATFDAIIMHHVIEHLHHPEMVLAECHRLLRTNGKLVVVTPNFESFGHRRFGADWRGLEPPRHIHIFSSKTVLKIAQDAGFRRCTLWTTAANAQGIAADSLYIQHANRHLVGDGLKPGILIAAILFQIWATIFCFTRKDSGEECVMKAEK
jgi:SAM-dependent methyltransferase